MRITKLLLCLLILKFKKTIANLDQEFACTDSGGLENAWQSSPPSLLATSFSVVHGIRTKFVREPNDIATIDAYIFDGSLMAAFVEYRRQTNADFNSAKTFIDQELGRIRNKHPWRFNEWKIQEVLFPSHEIMARLRRMNRGRFHLLNITSRLLEKSLTDRNYQVTLSARGVLLPDDLLPIPELMLFLFPESNPYASETNLVDAQVFLQSIVEHLEFRMQANSTDAKIKERQKRRDQQIKEYMINVKPLLTEDCKIYSYGNSIGLPGYHCYWFFAFLIHQPAANNCIVLTGMASD